MMFLDVRAANARNRKYPKLPGILIYFETDSECFCRKMAFTFL